jgi:hypothetical protein
MCAALPRSDYYGGSVPSQGPRPTAGLPAPGLAGQRDGRPREGSHVSHAPVDGAVPSLSPAASPHLRRRLSVWPPCQPDSPASESRCAALTRACTAARPISTRLEPVLALRGFDHWFSSAYTFPSCLPDPGRLAVPTRPVVVGAAPTLPGASRIRLPPASTACCDRPQAESFHLRPDTWNLVAHHRPPEHPGRLHPDHAHPETGQPVPQRQQPVGHGLGRYGSPGGVPHPSRARGRRPRRSSCARPARRSARSACPSDSSWSAAVARPEEPLCKESESRARSNTSGCPRLPRPTVARAHRHQG